MSSKVKYHIRNHRLKFIDRVVDGFAYYSYNTTGNISYIRCYERRSKACHARGKMQNGIPVLSTGHNHDKNPLLQNYCIFQDALFTAATARPYRSLRTIYDHFSVRHHEAAVQFTWAKMQPLMESWRRRERPRHPPIPTNLQQFADFLNMPQWASLLSYPQGQLSISTLATPDGSFLTVLYDLNFVQSVTGITTLFMDGTFKITPKKPNIFQVFTILGLINDNKALPLCWMLMKNKSAHSYQTGLSYFKNQVALHIDPQIIITDFETGLKNPIRSVYPEAAHTGCYFHFCQALTKKLKELNLLQLIRHWKYGQIFIRKIMALPLLPPVDAEEGFTWLIGNTPLDILDIFQEFILYFDGQWLQRVPPTLWSVHRYIHRTDNFTESYHKTAKIRFGEHPSIWEFTERLTELQGITQIEYVSLQNGLDVTRAARSHTIDTNKKIEKAWDLYHAESLDIPNFLACASHFSHAFKWEFQQPAENQQVADHRINVAGNVVNLMHNNYDHLLVFLELDVLEIN